MGSRGQYREPGPERDWAHLKREVAQLFPRLKGVRFTHRWAGGLRSIRTTCPDFMRPSLAFVAIGCQGRGIGWQTALGAELDKLATQTGYVPSCA